MSSWSHLIRFRAPDGLSYFASLTSVEDVARIEGQSVLAYATFSELEEGRAGTQTVIELLLAPIPYEGDIVCIGVNYRSHAEEAGLAVPKDPVMWYKPRRTLGGPGNISIPAVAGAGFLDFEGELTIVTSNDARDVSVEDASNYILGYTVGNDLTARVFQDPKRCGGQFTRCKAFDGFAPLGPVLTSAKAFGNVEDARIVVKVNGKVFQDSPCDLIHTPAALISFLSQGTTIPAGTAIMTGSPPGVGYFQNPKYSLRDGDVVEAEISSIGTLRSTMVFEGTKPRM